MPTLYLELNAERLVAGLREAQAAFKPVQAEAAATGKAIDQAAAQNKAMTDSVQGVVNATRLLPASTAAATTAVNANSAATVTAAKSQQTYVQGMQQAATASATAATAQQAYTQSVNQTAVASQSAAMAVRSQSGMMISALNQIPAGFTPVADVLGKWRREAAFASVAQGAMNVAMTTGSRIASGMLRALAITPIVAMSSAIVGLTGELISNALGFDKAGGAAEKYVEKMKAAATAAEEAARAQQVFAEIGDTAAAGESAQERLNAIKAQYKTIAGAQPNQVFPASDFEKFGVPPPTIPQSTQTKYTMTMGASGFAPPTTYEEPIGWQQMDALEAFRSYIASLEAETAAQTTATSEVKKLPDAVREFVANLRTFAGLPPNLQGAYIGAKVKGAFGADTNGASTADTAAEKAAAAERLQQQTEEARMRMRLNDALARAADDEEAAAKARHAREQAEERARAEMQRSADGFASGFSSAANSIFSGMNSLGGALEQFAQSVANQVLQQATIQPAANAVGGWIATGLGAATGGGTTASAKGNVFDPGGIVHRFAYGDIFDSPTRFRFGGGQRGEMGEAGPEAVMPLRRGPDGKLGVAAAAGGGGGGNTSISLHFQGTPDTHGMRRAGRQAAAVVERTMERRG